MTTDDQPAPVIEPAGSPVLRVIEPPDELAARRPPVRLRNTMTAAELMAKQFTPPRWAVPGLLAEGVSLLCGPPKVGKSWLSLGLALAIASGGKALDAIEVDPGPVLYLALEDTELRLQSRIGKLLGDTPAPDALTLTNECPPLPLGGSEAIADWIEHHPDVRMVIIDVFAKIRGASAPGMSAYDADYAAVGRAKKLADDYSIAVVVVHHVRKAGSDDFLTEVSGTNGLAGAADATLVLKRPRGQADGVLHVTGRDVDESEYPLAFEPTTGSWRLLAGPSDEHTVSDTRAAILRYLRTNPGAGPKAIAEGTGLSSDNVKRTVARMATDGQLLTGGRGQYRTPEGTGS